MQLAEYDALVHRIYNAALQPDRWSAVVGDIGRACEATRGLLFTPLHRPATGGFAFAHNLSESMMQRWGASGIADDPITQEAFARDLLVEGNAFNGCELIPRERLLASRLYRELWEPIGIGQVCSGVVFGGTDARTLPTAVSIYRDRGEPPFDASQPALMRRLMAHMSRSLGVMFHLRDSSLQAASNLGSLERLSTGVALLNSDGTLQFANAAADRIFCSGRHVTRQSSRAGTAPKLSLAARLAGQERRFQRAIAQALAPLDTTQEHFSNAVVLPDEQGKPSCVLHVAPLGDGLALAVANERPRAIVFLYDLSAAASVPPGLLCELFDLTGAEAQVALQVLQGGPAEAMARRSGVSINTFKTQLKAVYAKTRTNRHSDLLKLMLALAVA